MSDIAKSERELTTDLIWARRLSICSNARMEFLMTRRKYSLTERTGDSHFRPQCGACGGIKLHLIPSLANGWVIWVMCCCNRMSWYISSNIFFAPTKLRSLSLKMWVHLPFREIRRRSAARNVSVLGSVANSKCIALFLGWESSLSLT